MSSEMDKVKELRSRTGAGIVDCKKALADAGGDVEKAIELLRERGIAKAAKKAGRAASEGRIFSYVHMNGRIGTLVELNCETDFVARTKEFQELGEEIAMQIAATSPSYVSPQDVPEEVVAKEKEIYRKQALEEGKPEAVVEKIAEGRLKKFFEEACLLEQPYIRDDKKRIKDLINEAIAKLGENIVVSRFVRFEIGQS